MLTEYEWGTGWRPKNAKSVNPNVVGQTVERLAASAEDSTCAPGLLVDEARPVDSELHPLFEWDDSIAGESWRKQEARQIIRAVILRPEPSENPAEIEPPAFISILKPSAEEGGEATRGYVPLAVVLSDAQMHAQAVAEALAAFRGLKRRYDALKELSPIWDVVDKLAAEHGVVE